jgi:dTDP-4-dehydrorhamnose reductase
MAGHVVTTYLTSLNKYEIYQTDRVKFNDQTIILDITNKDAVLNVINQIKPDVIINLIGLLIKDSTEHPDTAIYINSFFPRMLEQILKNSPTKIIHLSTDCVFSGDKGGYLETDFKDGKDIYAQSKALGEIVNNKDLTFRLSIIGPELRANGSGLLHWFLQQKGEIKGFVNVFWTGITTLELAKAMDKAIDQNLTGLYHLIPNLKISKFELLRIFNETWHRNLKIIPEPNQRHDKSLINSRTDFNYTVPDYRAMVQELHTWMQQQKFPQYQRYH